MKKITGGNSFWKNGAIFNQPSIKYYLRMGKPWKGPLVSPKLGFGLGFAKLKAWVKASF
ncbi:MAG: hypothetical protein R3B93_16310 [Bacteroidia bacterium]